jgi:hypothetical protein
MAWPPRPGELLPRPEGAYEIREKLATYSLDPSHERGGPKARGFALILGITINSIDYLEAHIRVGIQRYPITVVVDNRPHGWSCVVEFPIRGVGRYSQREASLRTIWELAAPTVPRG